MSEGQDKLTGLRDVRKPCHFWVDNEIADCYQPIVGADAIWVYCRIARNAHGAWIVSPKVRGGDTRVSLREMADWCGKSVDTVSRCLQVLEHVGLLRAVRGAKAKGQYALVDVKDLVTREGGLYDREIGSFQLPAQRVDELKEQVKLLRTKLARKSSEQWTVNSGQKDAAATVAQSDSLENDLFAVPAAGCDSSVARSDTSVAPGAIASITTKNKEAKLATPPQPPLAHPNGQKAPAGDPGAGAYGFDVLDDPPFTEEQLAHLARHADDASWTAEWEGYYREVNQAAAREEAKAAEAERVEAMRLESLKTELATVPAAQAWVMRQCGFVKNRRRRGVEPVIEAVLAQDLATGKPLWETAPKMAEAWKSYQSNGEFLRVQYGPVKFFELGIWRDPRGWAWNEEKLERQRGARVESAR